MMWSSVSQSHSVNMIIQLLSGGFLQRSGLMKFGINKSNLKTYSTLILLLSFHSLFTLDFSCGQIVVTTSVFSQDLYIYLSISIFMV